MLTLIRNSKLDTLTAHGKQVSDARPTLNAFRFDFADAQYFSRRSILFDFITKKNYFSLIHSKKIDKLHLVDKNERNLRLGNTGLTARCLTIGMTHPADLSARQSSPNRYAQVIK